MPKDSVSEKRRGAQGEFTPRQTGGTVTHVSPRSGWESSRDSRLSESGPLHTKGWLVHATRHSVNGRTRADEVQGSPRLRPFFLFTGVMGEYEPKIEVQFPETVSTAKGATARLECFALGK